MPDLWFENERTGKRYKIVEFNKRKGTVKLKGEHAEFTEKYDKDKFQSMGYALKQA
ncbi:MAG: hypothetical protein M3R04_03495 [bacterium]|nr:hypothetical protein [bacterium]